jgi:hypothetical protein
MIAAAPMPTAAAMRKSNRSTVMMFFSVPKVPGPRRRSAFERRQRLAGCRCAARERLIAQWVGFDQVAGGRHAQRRIEINFGRN